MSHNLAFGAALNTQPVLIAGSLLLFVGGTALLLQVPAAREAARAIVLDPRTMAAGRQAATILGRAILESLTSQSSRTALPSGDILNGVGS